MSGNLLLLLLAALANLFLGIGVWARSPRDLTNRYFGIFSLAVSTWIISNWFVNVYAATNWGFFWGRLAFATGAMISVSFFFFVSVFPSPIPRIPKLLTGLFLVAGMAAFLTSLTPLIVEDTTSAHGMLTVLYGPLHPVFAVYFIFCIGYSLLLLKRKLTLLKGIEAIRVRYVFLGALIIGVGATITNLLIPLVFGTSRFAQYGPLFSFGMVAMIAHAIIRHRLMDIRVVIRKGVVYVVAFVAAGTLLTGLIISSNFLFPEERWRLGREIFLGLVVAALFHPLKSWIQHAFDRYLYRESYDYQRTLREASRVMTTMLDLPSVLAYVSDVISKAIRPEIVSIYLRDRHGSDYRRTLTGSITEGGISGEPETVAGLSALATILRRERAHLLRDDLRRHDLDPETRAALEELGTLGGDLALPLLKEDQVTGFVLLGPKRSGDPYFEEDLGLLSTLASQAAIAVTNAQLYAEVLLVNEYVQNILKTMESGVIAASVEGEVTLFNSEAERMTGLAATSVRSGPVDRLPGVLADLIRVTLADGVPRLQAERALVENGGQEIPVVCSTSSFTDARGQVLGAVLVFSDLTRIKELESEKRRAERLASFEAMTRGIAHEIKNPLVAIKTFAQLLPTKFADQEFRDNFSRVAVREVERIDGLVDRLRVLAAPSKALHPLDVREPIEETLELLRAQLDERRISVTRLYDEAIPAIQGDQAQLKQLFLNLFLNAVEAMEPGGALTVRLKTQAAPDSATLLVEVVDTGCGIPEAIVDKVFDPFFSTKSRGTGLGLAICRGIADAHRATIRAENTPGASGTTIALTFPAAARIATEVQA